MRHASNILNTWPTMRNSDPVWVQGTLQRSKPRWSRYVNILIGFVSNLSRRFVGIGCQVFPSVSCIENPVRMSRCLWSRRIAVAQAIGWAVFNWSPQPDAFGAAGLRRWPRKGTVFVASRPSKQLETHSRKSST